MARVRLNRVGKVFTNGSVALSDLSLTVEDGELVVFVGPSGCGKTTALRIVAGLEEATTGTVEIGERVVNGIPPQERDVAMVFQNYALYPHMTVAENIGFGLSLRKLPRIDIASKVSAAAEMLGLSKVLQQKPGQLSGGQRQRVAMGRAIVREPAVFLMDEPLSNLDARLRVQMRSEILRVHQRLGVATIYVTHDQTEAMTMGNRVAVIQGGVLQQCGAPQDVYDHPVNVFVGSFIGSPSMNLFRGEVSQNGTVVRIGEEILGLSRDVGKRERVRPFEGRAVVVGIRPEDLKVDEEPRTDEVRLTLAGEVELVEPLGPEQLVHFRLGGAGRGEESSHVADESGIVGGEDSLVASLEGVARVEPTVRVVPGMNVSLRVEIEHIHLFDVDTGLSII